MVPLAAAVDDFQELVFARARVVALGQGAGQRFLRLGQGQGFLEINLVNPLRPGLVGTIDLDLPVNPTGRRIAGSIRSARLEARMTTTFCSGSMPSISEQNIGTTVLNML